MHSYKCASLFIYLCLQTTTKKKITSAFSFPAQLDMRHRLPELSQFDLVYDLSAVLIHKGTGVNSGHYIAHIKDKNTGQWWEFDDEHVTNLGNHPFGEGSSSSTTKSIATDAIHSDCSEARIAESNGNGSHTTHSQSSLIETFSSCDAYMLMYHLRHTKGVKENGGIVCGASHKEIEGVVATAQDDASLPSHLYDEICNVNASYLDACQQYSHRKELELSRITDRRHEVRSILAEAPVPPLERPFYWISSDWLRHWADNIIPTLVHIFVQYYSGHALFNVFKFVCQLFV